MAVTKTNAMRILDQRKIEYFTYTYDGSDGKIDGIAVAEKINKDPNILYKTLVTRGNSKNIYVFLITVAEELDLKKAAKAAEEKGIELIPVKDLLDLTGYVRGGCSPIGMKKSFKTFIDKSVMKNTEVGTVADTKAIQQDNWIIVSGGKIGIQLQLDRAKLIAITNASIVDLCKTDDVLNEN